MINNKIKINLNQNKKSQVMTQAIKINYIIGFQLDI